MHTSLMLCNVTPSAVVLYYVGAGRRNTGDWCFSDGYVTFRNIADLYLKAPHLNGRVLTIVTDCSYSGCWVRDCEQFLDYHQVQPCGHKAREKGMLIKVYAACLPTQIPTKFQLTVHGGGNDKDTGDKYTESSKYLLETQHTYSTNSSRIRCSGRTIDDPCTLKDQFTWKSWRIYNRIHLEKGDSGSQLYWQYVKLIDDEEVIHNVKLGKLKASENGVVIKRGSGEDPPDSDKQWISKEYGPCK